MANRSSDIESEDDPPANPWGNIGAKTIASMLAKKDTLRRESKLASKKLKNNVGAPGTQLLRKRAANLFNAFYTGVLERSVRETPKAIDLERLLYSFVGDLNGKVNGVRSCSYVRNILRSVIEQCHFDYKDFKVSRHDRERLAAVFKDLLDKGQLRKEPYLELLWVGTFVVRRLVQALWEDALTHGTRSWDVRLCKVLSLTLVSALVARGGNVLRSDKYKGAVCLCYKHVAIKLVETKTGPSVSALITMAVNKGFKDDPDNSPPVRLDMLQGKAANIMCPVKLIIIIAMRIGAVPATTIDNVISQARARRDKTIVWSKSALEWPLQPSFTRIGLAIVPDNAAATAQLTKTLSQASDLAGLLKRPKPHDLRRGAVRDVVYTQGVQAINEDLAAQVLNHTSKSKQNGLSMKYVGHAKEPNYTKRVEQFADGDEEKVFGMDFAGSTFKKRRLNPCEITDFCNKNQLDASNAKVRQEAARTMHSQMRKDWAEAQMTVQHHGRQGHRVNSRQPLAQLAAGDTNARSRASSNCAVDRSAQHTIDKAVDEDATVDEPPQHGQFSTVDGIFGADDSMSVDFDELGDVDDSADADESVDASESDA